MAKLTFPAALNKAFRHNISVLKTQFQMIASWAESAEAKADVNRQLQVLATATGFVQDQPATKALVSNGQALTVPVTGTYATKATVTVAGGVVTAIVLS